MRNYYCTTVQLATFDENQQKKIYIRKIDRTTQMFTKYFTLFFLLYLPEMM